MNHEADQLHLQATEAQTELAETKLESEELRQEVRRLQAALDVANTDLEYFDERFQTAQSESTQTETLVFEVETQTNMSDGRPADFGTPKNRPLLKSVMQQTDEVKAFMKA